MSEEKNIQDISQLLSRLKAYLSLKENLKKSENKILSDEKSTFFDLIFIFSDLFEGDKIFLEALKQVENETNNKALFEEWLVKQLDDT